MKLSQYAVRCLPFCFILMLGVVGFASLMNLRRSPRTLQSSQVAPLVETISIQRGANSIRLEADGEVVPFKQVSLAAQVAGPIVVKDDNCRAGRYVERGQKLMQIDPRDYELEIRRTQELIKQTAVNVEELDVEVANTQELVELAKQDRDLQENEITRYEELIQQRATSQATLDTARRGRIQAINALQAQRNQLRLLQTRRGRLLSEKERLAVQLEQALLNRSRCDILSPLDGIIVSDPVEQDDFVQPGTLLVQVEDAERLEVRFDLKLKQLRWIWDSIDDAQVDVPTAHASFRLPQLPIAIHMDAEQGSYYWSGQLTRYDDAGLDPATRTVACIATVRDPRDGRWQAESGAIGGRQQATAPPSLMRGMFVRVEIEVPCEQPLLTIPISALRPGNRVWLERDGILHVAEVKVAQSLEDRVAVFPSAEIKAGDSLVVTPLSLGIDGMAVRSEPTTIAVAEIEPASARADGFEGGDNSGASPVGVKMAKPERSQ